MNHATRTGGSTDRFFMIVSAVLFAYFGYFAGLTPTTIGGQFVLFFAILIWTLRICAAGFALSVVVSFLAPVWGSVLYALFGLGSAAGLVTVAIMDVLDTQNIAAIGPFWAFVFAAWNGYGSWVSLREIMAARRTPRDLIDTAHEPEL